MVCSAVMVGAALPEPAHAQLPAVNELLKIESETQGGALVLGTNSSTGNGLFTFSVGGLDISLGSNALSKPIDITGNVDLTLKLPIGFALISALCSDGTSLVNTGNLTSTIILPVNVVGSVSCTFNTVNSREVAAETILPFLFRRNDLMLSLDVGNGRQIDRLMGSAGGSGGGFAGLGGPMGLGFASGDDEPTRFSFATSLQQMRQASAAREDAWIEASHLGAGSRAPAPARHSPFDIWAEGHFNSFDQSTRALDGDGHSAVFFTGLDWVLGPYVLIGALVQIDDTDAKSTGVAPGRVSQTGWMAGPYATVRLSDHLFFQARAAWGQSDNDVSTTNTSDHFDTDRWLVRGTLLGQWQEGPWQFRPRASVAYIEEDQKAYVDALNVLVPSHTVTLGQAKFGPEIAYRHILPDGTLVEPSLLIEGIWNFEESTGLLLTDDLVASDGVRGRVELGLTVVAADGLLFGAAVSYDGIGSDSYHSVGGKARVRLPLN